MGIAAIILHIVFKTLYWGTPIALIVVSLKTCQNLPVEDRKLPYALVALSVFALIMGALNQAVGR